MNGKVLERYAELMIDKIRQMSAGEWQKPWFTPRAGLPQNISGRPYNSMNRLMLYMEMDRMGYTLPVFMTFRQLKDENLMVIKGSHALPVTFYDITVKHKTTGEKISFDDYKSIIRKTKCFDFWERNVLFPKTKRSFFRTPKHPLPCPFPLNFSLLIITKKFGNLAKNRYICIV